MSSKIKRQHYITIFSAAAFASGLCFNAAAQEMRLEFEGNAAPGKIVKEVDGNDPGYVDGRTGQAIEFRGGAAVAILKDLDPKTNPRITITAWIKRSPTTNLAWIAGSVESKGHPGLLIYSSKLRGWGGRARITMDTDNATIEPDTWTHVAGVWDYDAETMTLYKGGYPRKFTNDLRMNVEDPTEVGDATLVNGPSGNGAYFTIGAQDIEDFRADAKGLIIDDLRVYFRALSDDELKLLGSGVADIDTGIDDPLGDVDLGGIIDEPVAVPTIDCEAEGAVCNPPTESSPSTESGSDSATDADDGADDGAGDGSLPEPGVIGEGPVIDPDIGNDEQNLDPDARPAPADDIVLFSDVSGRSANTRRDVVDLETGFLNKITWSERGDRPCFVELGDTAGSKTTRKDIGCNGSRGETKSVALHNRAIVTRLKVCENDRDNERIKGVWISGSGVRNTGEVRDRIESDSEELTHCRKWAGEVSCPADTFATGLGVYSTAARGSRRQIVGLSLACRAITMK